MKGEDDRAGVEIAYHVTFLEMRERPTTPHPPLPSGAPAALVRAVAPPPWYFRALYEAVGREYGWHDLNAWSDATLAERLAAPRAALYSLLQEGWPKGFFLLEERDEAVCELSYFGLAPQAVGRGLGRYLLQAAIHTAWERDGVEKLTVKTCTLDHPRALGLYQRAGFAVTGREARSRKLDRLPEHLQP